MTAIRVRMDQLYPDPLNRPAGSGNQELEALAETIRALGVLIPPLVEPIDGRPGCFRIKDGRRRYAAAELAGVEELEVIVRPAGAAPPKVTSALTTIVTSSHHTPHQAVACGPCFELVIRADALRSPLGDPSEEITGPEDRWNDPRLVCGGGQA